MSSFAAAGRCEGPSAFSVGRSVGRSVDLLRMLVEMVRSLCCFQSYGDKTTDRLCEREIEKNCPETGGKNKLRHTHTHTDRVASFEKRKTSSTKFSF